VRHSNSRGSVSVCAVRTASLSGPRPHSRPYWRRAVRLGVLAGGGRSIWQETSRPSPGSQPSLPVPSYVHLAISSDSASVDAHVVRFAATTCRHAVAPSGALRRDSWCILRPRLTIASCVRCPPVRDRVCPLFGRNVLSDSRGAASAAQRAQRCRNQQCHDEGRLNRSQPHGLIILPLPGARQVQWPCQPCGHLRSTL
jgi:hypothetical protein